MKIIKKYAINDKQSGFRKRQENIDIYYSIGSKIDLNRQNRLQTVLSLPDISKHV